MATNPAGGPPEKATQERESVVIRFAGDSGDGMQLTGTRFIESVLAGNDVGTLPDFPAKTRPYWDAVWRERFRSILVIKCLYTGG